MHLYKQWLTKKLLGEVIKINVSGVIPIMFFECLYSSNKLLYILCDLVIIIHVKRREKFVTIWSDIWRMFVIQAGYRLTTDVRRMITLKMYRCICWMYDIVSVISLRSLNFNGRLFIINICCSTYHQCDD